MITIYLGDVSEYLSNLVHKTYPTAELVDSSNFDNLTAGVYYTSIGDLGDVKNLGTVLRSAYKIVYSPPDVWSDTRQGKSVMKKLTEDYLKIFSLRIPVENFSIPTPANKQNILALQDFRKTDKHQLWIAGCSFAHGVGVTLDQRYGQLLADELNLDASFLTLRASSIAWSADQILRSDIRENDLVVWGLTSPYRAPYFINGNLDYVRPGQFGPNPSINPEDRGVDYLTSEDLQYRLVTDIFQVNNFCKKINAKLLIVSMLDEIMVEYINDFPNLLMLYHLWGRGEMKDRLYDVGDDNRHPGPLTHRFYADEILKKLKLLEWI
jgi:hypothetical protein